MSIATWLPALVAVLAASRLGTQTVAVSKLDETTFRYAVTEERDRFWKIYDEYAKEREALDKDRFGRPAPPQVRGGAAAEDVGPRRRALVRPR